MILGSGRIKNKMANNRPEEPDRKIEATQENVNFEEARGLPNPEVNFSKVMVGHSVSQSSTRTIPIIINRSAGRGRGFMRINPETIQNRHKITNGNKRTVPNNPNQSLLCDGIKLPFRDLSKSTNSHPDKEVTGNETFQIDSFLEETNPFHSGKGK